MNAVCYFVVLFVGICSVCSQNNEVTEENFTYPCSATEDVDNCIRTYLLDTGNCRESQHDDGVPIPGQSHNAFLQKNNLTASVEGANVTFVNPQLRALYKNEDTNNLVFAVEFEAIILDSNTVTYRFHQPAKEPIIVEDYLHAICPTILTAVIDVRDGLTKEALKGASITAYLTTAFPRFQIGPTVYLNSLSSPIVFWSIVSLYLDVPTAVKEALLTGAPHFFLLYLQEYYCHFGITLIATNWGNTI